jgi:hypothetical protein
MLVRSMRTRLRRARRSIEARTEDSVGIGGKAGSYGRWRRVINPDTIIIFSWSSLSHTKRDTDAIQIKLKEIIAH